MASRKERVLLSCEGHLQELGRGCWGLVGFACGGSFPLIQSTMAHVTMNIKLFSGIT